MPLGLAFLLKHLIRERWGLPNSWLKTRTNSPLVMRIRNPWSLMTCCWLLRRARRVTCKPWSTRTPLNHWKAATLINSWPQLVAQQKSKRELFLTWTHRWNPSTHMMTLRTFPSDRFPLLLWCSNRHQSRLILIHQLISNPILMTMMRMMMMT